MPAHLHRHVPPRHRRYGGHLTRGRARLGWVVAGLVLAGVVAVPLVLPPGLSLPGGVAGRPSAGASPPSADRPVSGTGGGRPSPRHESTEQDRWRPVLRRVDRRRARAWAQGRPAMLRQVYVADSPSLKVDRRRLRSYVARGLRVSGARIRFSSVRVLRQRPNRVRLAVRDRLGTAATVHGPGLRRRLPADRPSRHVVVLKRVQGRWLIHSVQRP